MKSIFILVVLIGITTQDNLFQEAQALVQDLLAVEPFMRRTDCNNKCEAHFDALGGRDKGSTDHACEVECRLLTFN